MTTQEFSLEFDILYNSIASDAAPPVDEYEKSVFLTKAQRDLVLSIYKGESNGTLSFEGEEEARSYLYELNKRTELTPDGDNYVSLPSDLWFITMESAEYGNNEDPCIDGQIVEIQPVRQELYHRTVKNPFRRATKNRVLRLSIDNKFKLISKYKVQKYIVDYVKAPSPIILEVLPEGITIENESTPMTCLLNDSLHRSILDRAVLLAKNAYMNSSNDVK